MEIRITGSNVSELRDKIVALASVIDSGFTTIMNNMNQAQPTAQPQAQAEAAETKTDEAAPANKRGRKPKEKAEEAPAKDEKPAAPTAPIALEDVRSAFQKYVKTNGMPAGVALLEEFGASRFSDLKPEQMAEFFDKVR
jgi:cytoskeletal protein RodZ